VKIFQRNAAVLLLASLPCAEACALESQHFPADPTSAIDALAVGPGGAVWFITAQSVGYFPAQGNTVRFSLPKVHEGFAAGPDGNVWFAMPSDIGYSIDEITPAGMLIVKADLAIQPVGIVTGPGGKLWVSYLSFDNVGHLGYLKADGSLQSFPMNYGLPREMILGPDGNIWFPLQNQIGLMTPLGEVAVFDVPVPTTIYGPIYPVWLANGPDGKLVLTQNSVDAAICPSPTLGAAVAQIGVQGAGSAYLMPENESSAAGGVATGADGNIWALEWNNNYSTCSLVRRISDGTFTRFLIDSWCGTVLADKEGNLWIPGSNNLQAIKVTIPHDLIFSDGMDSL
jgi:streptogramin lyase